MIKERKKMTKTSEIKKNKDKMDMQIKLSIQNAMNNFRKQTGLSPSSFDVRIFDATTSDDKTRRYCIHSVNSTVILEVI